jgi:hypothetical protein
MLSDDSIKNENKEEEKKARTPMIDPVSVRKSSFAHKETTLLKRKSIKEPTSHTPKLKSSQSSSQVTSDSLLK